MSNVKYPDIEVQLTGNDGNAFAILGAVQGAMRRAGIEKAEQDAFYAEATRVARPGALLVVWNYPRPKFADPELERRFLGFYRDVVGPYWPPERRHIEANYSTLPFPFEKIDAPPFGLELDWGLEQVIGYVSSWSATARYRKALGKDPVPLLAESLGAVWPGAGASVAVRMPLGLRAGRLRPAA